MGTRLRARVTAPDAAAGFSAIEAVFTEVERLEALLSSWREDSELSRLNSAPPGTPIEVSPELLELLVEVWGWIPRTGAAFDPTVGALIDAWDLRGAGRRPSPVELERARGWSGREMFEFDPSAGRAVRRCAGSWITAGGFGKGAALRSAGRVLDAAGIEAALLDFGGQILARGSSPEGEGWLVEVADPRRRDRGRIALRVRDRSVATSSASERYVEVAGKRLGHVLDPRRGYPVPAWGSVTVVARDPLVADVLATALFVLGPDEGLAHVDDLEDVAVLFLREETGRLEARWSPGMEKWLVKGDKG